MCGILLVLSKTGSLDSSPCRRALSTLYWRGPDFAASRLWESRLFLGQTVLSITGDPRGGEGDYQRSKSGRYEILFNGQIYNFGQLEARFLRPRPDLTTRSGTDTEVLANLHEVLPAAEVPPLLDGMYTYVLFDEKARQVHLVRDVQGEKSLYVYEDERLVVVASEIRAIRSLVPAIGSDHQALRDYFRTRHLMLLNRTVHHGIRELPPGHFDTLDLDALAWSPRRIGRLRDWIEPQRMLDNARRGPDSLADELDALLADCVDEMIPKSRRYAVVVSGGVDSSLVAHYLVTRGNPDLFVAVNHVGKDRLSADLSGFEKALDRSIATLQVDAPSYAAEIARCQQACGGPLHSHSFVPQSQQSAFVRASGCRVLFGGDGADELFGGYEAYLGPYAAKGRFSPSPYMAYLPTLLKFRLDDPNPFREELAAAWLDACEAYAFIENRQDCERLAMMYCDSAWQLPGVGLRGADLMSMMWSVETRSVYLRRPLVQFALNLPAAMKVNPDVKISPLLRAKPLLKRLFLRYFPASLLGEKQGFGGFPNEAGAWLGPPTDYLAVADLQIHPGSLEAAWSDQATAWKLINIEYFLRYGRA
jgi:asparagine synthase (glutamine-hydrolysing)